MTPAPDLTARRTILPAAHELHIGAVRSMVEAGEYVAALDDVARFNAEVRQIFGLVADVAGNA